MLAATIALSPVVTTGVVGSPVKVEAAVTQDALSRVNLIYSELIKVEGAKEAFNRSGKTLNEWGPEIWNNEVLGDTAVNTINTNIRNLTAENLKEADRSKLEAVKKVNAAGIVKELVLLVVQDGTTLAQRLDSFKSSNEGIAFEAVLGLEGSEIDLILEFLVECEKEMWKLSTSEIISMWNDLKTGSIKNVTKTVRDKVTAQAKFKNLNDTLRVKSGLSLDDVFGVYDNVVAKLPANDAKILRTAFIDAALAAGNPNGGSTGGGGGTTTPTPGQNEVTLPAGSVVVENGTTKIPASKVQDIVNAVTADKAVIPVKLDGTTNAEVPASLFSEVVKKNAKAVVEVKTDVASYKLPASQINVADLAKQLGVAAADVKISVSVKVVDVKTSEKLASKVVEFKIEAVAGDKKQAVSTFSVYVERAISGDQNFNAKNQVAVVLDDNGKVLKSVPTVFDGKTATVKSLTNSKYAIVENNVTFPDVTNKEWAKSYIETLASKYIVKGHDTGKFAPNGTTTRAEFAVLLVRALGLPGEKYDNRFSDVKGTEWFNENGELAAAVKHGIIEGYDTGKFNPNGKVSRAEAAAMIARAIELDFLNFDKSKFDSSKQLTKFKDANKVPAWAKEELTAVLQAGIMSGHENNTIDANGSTTRNQIAKIVAELLIKSNLMNDTINK